jgi:acetylornithine deacetylase
LTTIQPNGISMNLSPNEKHIIAAVDALEDDIIDLTGRLVAEPSTLGKEQSVLRLMETKLADIGFQPERLPIVPHELSAHPGYAPVPWDYDNRYNLVASEPASGAGGRSALFNGHLDVVSPEPAEFWDHDPFDPQIHDGWLHGRGSGDMKSGIAAMIYAVQAVKNAGFGLNGPVTIETVIEEECSGNGALACIAAGHDADAVLIPEPFGPTILTHQVGVLWFEDGRHG